MDNLMMLGRWIMVAGIVLAVVGGIVWLLGRAGLNNIPGTIRFQSGGLTCVIPILASIVLSIVLTIVLNVIARFISK